MIWILHTKKILIVGKICWFGSVKESLLNLFTNTVQFARINSVHFITRFILIISGKFLMNFAIFMKTGSREWRVMIFNDLSGTKTFDWIDNLHTFDGFIIKAFSIAITWIEFFSQANWMWSNKLRRFTLDENH